MFALGGTNSAYAGLYRDIGFALGQSGFTIAGDRNLLSGGEDFFVGRTFVANTLDFGAWDLTLQGPIAVELSTGGRYLSQFDFDFTTSTGNGAASQPLNYTLNYDVGGQSATITGSILIDGGVSLNGFGFYDLDFTYSSRQEVTREGRFANDVTDFDFDLGPISVSGNVFADVLALVTQPIFEASGTVNPFASFSGAAKLREIIDLTALAAVQQLASDENLLQPGQAFIQSGPQTSSVVLTGLSTTPFIPSQSLTVNSAGRVVPEPAVVILLLLGVPLVVRRRPQVH